jgi:hypothetical protein
VSEGEVIDKDNKGTIKTNGPMIAFPVNCLSDFLLFILLSRNLKLLSQQMGMTNKRIIFERSDKLFDSELLSVTCCSSKFFS